MKATIDLSGLTLENIPDFVDVNQAAAAAKVSVKVIRDACKRGDLPSFIPGARPATAPGRGMGYRIKKADLQAWFFGQLRGEG